MPALWIHAVATLADEILRFGKQLLVQFGTSERIEWLYGNEARVVWVRSQFVLMGECLFGTSGSGLRERVIHHGTIRRSVITSVVMHLLLRSPLIVR